MDTTPHDTTPKYLDGPRLCAWIDEEEGGHPENADLRLGFHARKVRAWREGGTASVATADLILMKLGLHLGMVPDDVYVASNRRGELGAEIISRVVGQGQGIKAVARELECAPATVRYHVQRYGELQSAA